MWISLDYSQSTIISEAHVYSEFQTHAHMTNPQRPILVIHIMIQVALNILYIM